MKLNIEPVKGWFGFTRRERRASAILLVIIVVIIAFRSVLPEETTTFKETVIPHVAMATGEVKSLPREVNQNRASGIGMKKPGISNNRVYQKRIPIELNGSDSSTLVSLPGIGPVLSSRIIKFRNLLGGYATVDQLKEVYGLPEETFNLIRDRVYADTTLLRPIYVNSADYKTLSKFPYFERSEVSAILKYRELKGKLNTISDLTDNKLINPDKANKIRPYLRFE